MENENIYVYRLSGKNEQFAAIKDYAQKSEGVEEALLEGDKLTLQLSSSASEYDIFIALNEQCEKVGVDFDYYPEPLETDEHISASEEKVTAEVKQKEEVLPNEKKEEVVKSGKKRDFGDEAKPAFQKWTLQLIEIAFSFILILVAAIFDFDDNTETFLCLIAYTIVSYEVIWNAIAALCKKKFLNFSIGVLIALLAMLFVAGNYMEPAIIALLIQCEIVAGGLFYDLSLDKIKERLFFKFEQLTAPDATEDSEDVFACDAKEGETYVFEKGCVIPFDGVIADGAGAIDSYNYSGKHNSASVVVGKKVNGGDVVKSGRLVVRVEKKVNKSLSYRIYKRIKDETTVNYSPVLLILSLIAAFLLPLALMGEKGYVNAMYNTAYFAACLFLLSGGYAVASINRVARVSTVYRAITEGFVNANGVGLSKLSDIDTVVFDGEKLFENVIEKVVPIAEYKGKLSATLNSFGFKPADLTDSLKEYVKGGDVLVVADETELTKKGILYKSANTESCVRYACLNGQYIGAIVFERELKTDAFGAMRELYDCKVKSVVLYRGDVADLGDLEKVAEVYANLSSEQFNAKKEELTKTEKVAFYPLNDEIEEINGNAFKFIVKPYAGQKTDENVAVLAGSKIKAVAKSVKCAKKYISAKKYTIVCAVFKVVAIVFCGVALFAFAQKLAWVATLISVVASVITVFCAYLCSKEIY